jgi:hypothetical protein
VLAAEPLASDWRKYLLRAGRIWRTYEKNDCSLDNENGHVVGDYHDVPLGFRAFTDRIDLELDNTKLFLRATAGDSSIVGRGLYKLYDAPS